MRSDVGPSLSDATTDDAEALTTLLLRSRTRAMPWLASPHDEASTRWWVEHVLVADQHVRVALNDDRLLGFAAVEGDWLTQLYVDPDHQTDGVGRALLDDAKRRRPDGLRLHVFARNTRARRFYEAAGFVLVGRSDGHDNEEHEPDCTYAWTGSAPTSPAPPG
ncbi:GNAT family N-acetyltransferase [Pseudokineococcus basanitobsidens]|uniref:GNAT family N-acetyltransferase n=1 Tax=Pseudokineococcus basanitobsidens TaxID=1926649 RepID=A0ABU8RMV2_9ACTN